MRENDVYQSCVAHKILVMLECVQVECSALVCFLCVCVIKAALFHQSGGQGRKKDGVSCLEAVLAVNVEETSHLLLSGIRGQLVRRLAAGPFSARNSFIGCRAAV